MKLIGIDGGSTDSGPYYLGTGTSKYARATCKAEWRDLMIVREALGVPLVRIEVVELRAWGYGAPPKGRHCGPSGGRANAGRLGNRSRYGVGWPDDGHCGDIHLSNNTRRPPRRGMARRQNWRMRRALLH